MYCGSESGLLVNDKVNIVIKTVMKLKYFASFVIYLSLETQLINAFTCKL